MSARRLAAAIACTFVAAGVACSRPRESSLESSSASTSAAPTATLSRNARRLVGAWVRDVGELLESPKFQAWLATAPDPSAAKKQVIEEATHTRLVFRDDFTVTREDPPPEPSTTVHWKVEEESGDDVTITVDEKETVGFHFVDDDRMATDDGKAWARVHGKPDD